MPKESAGLLPWRRRDGRIEVFLVHPGGPFWARRDVGAWSIAKGEIEPGEEPLAAARRELREETGFVLDAPAVALGSVRQKAGKIVHAWAVEAELDPSQVRSSTFETEWPPRSGRLREFSEVDRAEWFPLDEARKRILPSQAPLLDELERRVG